VKLSTSVFSTMLLLAFFCGGSLPAAETVWLADLNLFQLQQDRGRPQIVTPDKPAYVGGQKLERGLVTHATSLFWIELGGDTTEFIAEVGVADGKQNELGSVRFEIMADGKWIWNSRILRFGEAANRCECPWRELKTCCSG